MKKIVTSILVLLISTISCAQEIKGADILDMLSGKTLKNYPIKTVKGYVSDNGTLTIKVMHNGSNKKYKGKITSDNIEWTKGNSGSSTLTLVKIDSNNWKLKDSNGWETPPFYLKEGNYYKY